MKKPKYRLTRKAYERILREKKEKREENQYREVEDNVYLK